MADVKKVGSSHGRQYTRTPERIELDRILVEPKVEALKDENLKKLTSKSCLAVQQLRFDRNIATPSDSDLEDKFIRQMMTSQLYPRERQETREKHDFTFLKEKR